MRSPGIMPSLLVAVPRGADRAWWGRGL